MGTKITRYSELQKNETNPFIGISTIEVGNKNKRVGIGNKMMIDEETGEVSNMRVVFSTQQKVDPEKFIKIYLSKVESYWDLSTPAKKVLKYVWGKLKPNMDEVYINMQSMMDEIGWEQSNQAYRGLIELCNCEILAKGNNAGFFFINPTIFFNGDRLILLDRYTKAKVGEVIPLEDPIKTVQSSFGKVDIGFPYIPGDDYVEIKNEGNDKEGSW